MLLNVHYLPNCKLKQDETINTVNIPIKICIYINYCMFDTPSQKPVQKCPILEIQRSKTSNYDLYKTLRIKSQNKQDITIKII